MKTKDWMLCIGVSVATLVVTLSVFWGGIALITDVGHAIIH
jgi:hypothetical protein